MTDEQANELLSNNDWAKWSDARDLLQTAAHMGAVEEAARWARAAEELAKEADRQFPEDGTVARWLRALVVERRA